MRFSLQPAGRSCWRRQAIDKIKELRFSALQNCRVTKIWNPAMQATHLAPPLLLTVCEVDILQSEKELLLETWVQNMQN